MESLLGNRCNHGIITPTKRYERVKMEIKFELQPVILDL